MAGLPHIFSTYPPGNFPASNWDDNFNAVANLAPFYCTATGTNTISLTPTLNPAPTALTAGMVFNFIAPNTTTGAVNITITSASVTAKLYDAGGTNQLGSDAVARALVANTFYSVQWNGGVFVMSTPVYSQLPQAFGGIAVDWPLIAGAATGHQLAPLDANVIYTGNGIYPFQVQTPNPYCAGSICTINSVSVGSAYSIQFVSTHLTPNTITVTYTAIVSDTVNTIASKLANVVNGTTTLNSGNGLPVFALAQGSGGLLNLQWDVRFGDLVPSSVGAGSITVPAPGRTLDFAQVNFCRLIPGYAGQSGDSTIAIEFFGQATTGALFGQALILSAITDSHAATFSGNLTFEIADQVAGKIVAQCGRGFLLFDSSGNIPAGGAQPGGYMGYGTMHVPATGGYFMAGQSTMILHVEAVAVNFNSGNTDTSIAIPIPTGFTRYRVQACVLSGASASISTATFGLFTLAAGGGTAIIAGGTAITVTASAEATNNNMQVTVPTNSNTQSFNVTPLFFRVGTAQGSAATANVTLLIEPMS